MQIGGDPIIDSEREEAVAIILYSHKNHNIISSKNLLNIQLATYART